MIKKLLLTSAIAFTSIMSMHAQLSKSLQQAPPFVIKNHTTQKLHKGNSVATVNCVDTNYYVDSKNSILNASQNYVSFPSTFGNQYSMGYSYLNSGTITVSALGFIAASGNTNIAVPAKAYLYNVNASGLPTTKIDSMSVSVSVANYYFGNLGLPRVITGNFAVVFKYGSTVATHTLAMYMTPAQTPAASTNNFGEGRGYVGVSASTFYTINAAFTSTSNPTPDFEPVVFPIYSYSMTANYLATPASPICITSPLVNTNTSVNTAVPENYMFNVGRFAKKWNIAITGLDSIYNWNFSDGTGRFISKNQNHTYASTGTFNDSLLLINNSWSGTGTCMDKKSTAITVVAQPTVVLTPAASTICVGATATITASGATTYAWQGGQSTASATYAPSSNSTYTVTGTNVCGTSVKTASVTLTSVAIISASTSNANLCTGQSATLTALGGNTYTWSPSATLSSPNGTTVTAMPTGNVTYTVTGTSSCGTGTASVVQNIASFPVISINSSTTSVCSGAPVTFTASGATTYAWVPVSSTNSIVTVNPTTGNSSYSVTGTSNFCSTTKSVSIVVSPSPTVTATASSSVICAGSTVTLTANGNGINYLWSNGSNGAVITATPSVTTTYSVGTINASFCTGVSNNVVVTVNTCTGIDELSGYSINVYPNPSTGVLNIAISSALANTSSIEIFDAIGKLVITQNLNNEQNVVNTSNLANGVYIYKIVNGNQSVKIGRIVKQ